MPVPWANMLSGGGLRIGRRAVLDALRNSIARLGVGSVDLYSLHAPLPYLGGRSALYEGLAEAFSLGLCRGVGVCNYNGGENSLPITIATRLCTLLSGHQTHQTTSPHPTTPHHNHITTIPTAHSHTIITLCIES